MTETFARNAPASTTIGIIEAIAITRQPMALMEPLEEVAVSLEAGLEHDIRGRKSRRKVSILFSQDWRDACRETGAPLDWLARRANLLVSGLRSPAEHGGTYIIGDGEDQGEGVILRVEMETDPCEVMDAARPGLRQAMTADWRGGVCCTVLKAGIIRTGDRVGYTGPC